MRTFDGRGAVETIGFGSGGRGGRDERWPRVNDGSFYERLGLALATCPSCSVAIVGRRDRVVYCHGCEQYGAAEAHRQASRQASRTETIVPLKADDSAPSGPETGPAVEVEVWTSGERELR